MSSLKEKERAKEQQEKFQAILSALLKDEDNKYCVDCDAKGPRWASWNLGIFLCIRCAGIHRNLGVHISKVKSVNLDTWTAEQVAMVQEIGNSRGRAVYEANIPDGFRRPQTDSALEAFIRSKYEHKKYIAREWVPPKPTVPKEWLEDPKAEKKRARSKPASTVQIPNVGKIASKPTVTPPVESAKPVQGTKTEVKPQPKPNAASNDLLGLDLGAPQTHTQQATAPAQPSGGNELLDLFGGPQTSSQAQGNAPAAPASNSDLMNGTSSEGNLFVEEKAAAGEEKKASTKDSIMALFGGGGGGGGGASQPQMYGVPDPRFVYYMYQHHEMNAPNFHAMMTNGANDLMKKQEVPNKAPPKDFAQPTINPSISFSQSQFMVPPSYSQSGVVMSAPANQQIAMNQSSFTSMPTHQPHYSQATVSFGSPSKPFVSGSGPPTNQHSAFPQSQAKQTNQKSVPGSQGHQTLAVFGHLTSPARGQNFPTKTVAVSQASGYGQPLAQNQAWAYYNQVQPGYFGNQGGVYMPQGQQMYPNMPGQQQGMMPPQGMMGQPQGMMGQPQGMMGQQGMMGHNQGMGMMGQQGNMRPPQGMMGQPQGMMGNPAMNGQQAAMYNGQQGMGANPGMYTPQQMQQLQYQQMQQQMTALNVGGPQMGGVPQQATSAAGGWGNPSQGQTLSTNLWQ